MKLTGNRKLERQFKKLPKTARKRLQRTVQRHTEEGARVARALAPVKSGKTKTDIFTQYALDGMTGSVEAAQSNKADQIRAMAIEGGREKGEHGTTDPHPYIGPTRRHLAKKFATSVKRAMRQAAKEVMNGG